MLPICKLAVFLTLTQSKNSISRGALSPTFVKGEILDPPLQKHEILVSSGEMMSFPLSLV